MEVPTPEGRPGALRPGTAVVVALVALGLVALLAVVVYLAGRLPWDGRPRVDVVTTPDAVVAQPDGFYGKTVTVTGRITRVVGRRAFAIGGDLSTASELLVVPAASIPAPAGRTPELPWLTEDIVRLTGEVRRFELTSFQRDAGAALDGDAVRGWEGRPALLAQTVELSPRRQPGA